MNTASRDRLFHKLVMEHMRGTDKRHTPVSRVKLVKGKDGNVLVTLHTSRPAILRMEADDIATSIKDQIGGERGVNIQVIPEARAVAKFIRSSPRKARLVLDAIKGKRVSEALALLQFIPNHAAESITKVLKSAAANAQDGWGALPEELKIANAIADGGPSLKRVRPRAQGRAYRILKRTSHLTMVLTEMPAPTPKRRPQGKPKVKAAPVSKPATVKAAPTTPVAQSATISVEESTTTPAVATQSSAPEASAAAPQSTVDMAEEATPVSASDAPEEASGASTEISGEPDTEAEPNQE